MAYQYSPGWRKLTIVILRPVLYGMLKRDWRRSRNVPRTGGLIVAANHISESDPLALAHFVYEAGRYPVYLAKSTLFRKGFVGRVMRGTGQIPVYRDRTDAAMALREAEEALAAGQCLMFYPEGTCTRDPDLWPMTGQTGVARLALTTGAPVLPVASWGAHELLPYRKGEKGGLAGRLRPGFHPFPRKTMHVVSGEPVDLSKYEGLPLTATTLRAATTDIMRAIAELVGELRGESPPAQLYDHHKAIEQRRQTTAAAQTTDAQAAQDEAEAQAAQTKPATPETPQAKTPPPKPEAPAAETEPGPAEPKAPTTDTEVPAAEVNAPASEPKVGTAEAEVAAAETQAPAPKAEASAAEAGGAAVEAPGGGGGSERVGAGDAGDAGEAGDAAGAAGTTGTAGSTGTAGEEEAQRP